jgi:4a-hydroxytetrahydrobiopterin dehydratase
MSKLGRQEIKEALAEVPDWNQKAAAITRTYQFEDFPDAIRFVNALAKIAEKVEHHPDIDIRWNKVTLSLTTHDEGGLTRKDFELAKRLDRLCTG